MFKILPMVGGALLLFVVIIVAIVLSSSNKKKRETRVQEQRGLNRNNEEMGYQQTVSLRNQNVNSIPQDNFAPEAHEDFGSVPKLDREQREEIAELAYRSTVKGTQLLMPNESYGEAGNLAANEEEDYYAVLQYNEGGLQKEFKMTSENVNVGRDPESSNFIISYDDFVGRNHAVIYFQQGKFYVRDLKSRNGTFVNDKRITDISELENNTKLRFANTDVIFKINI